MWNEYLERRGEKRNQDKTRDKKMTPQNTISDRKNLALLCFLFSKLDQNNDMTCKPRAQKEAGTVTSVSSHYRSYIQRKKLNNNKNNRNIVHPAHRPPKLDHKDRGNYLLMKQAPSTTCRTLKKRGTRKRASCIKRPVIFLLNNNKGQVLQASPSLR